MNTKFRILCFCLISILVACGSKAGGSSLNPQASSTPQTQPTHELIRLRSLTPAEAAVIAPDGFLQMGYADLRATELARPGVPLPARWADLDIHSTAFNLWYSNSFRLYYGLAPDLFSVLGFDEKLVDYYGLDFFEIDRTFYFGAPPQGGTIYSGHFDSQRIIQTLTARTYTLTESNGIPVLCGPVGCDKGLEPKNWLPDTKVDPRTMRHIGTYPIFDGSAGRQQPLALPPGVILTSGDWNQINQMTAATAGLADSLYTVPEFRAVADFAATDIPLIQVLFYIPVYSAVPADTETLPPYKLGALVDQQIGADQVYRIVLVYPTEAEAQQAAAEVSRRIPAYLDALALLPGNDIPRFKGLLASYKLDEPQVVHHAATNLWLAVATVRVPLPDNNLNPETKSYEPSGSLILYLSGMSHDYFTPAMLSP